MSDSGSGRVYLRGQVGGPVYLVVELPGCAPVVFEASSDMQDLFTATVRGEYTGTTQQLATAVRAMIRPQRPLADPDRVRSLI